jgi:hypothetical protein
MLYELLERKILQTSVSLESSWIYLRVYIDKPILTSLLLNLKYYCQNLLDVALLQVRTIYNELYS